MHAHIYGGCASHHPNPFMSHGILLWRASSSRQNSIIFQFMQETRVRTRVYVIRAFQRVFRRRMSPRSVGISSGAGIVFSLSDRVRD